MTVEVVPWALNSVSTDSAVARHALQAVLAGPIGSFAGGVGATRGGAHGVAGVFDLLVTESLSPAMTVRVAVGVAFVTGTASALQGPYSFHNDAAIDNVTIAAADATNPRNDLVCAQVRDTTYDGSGFRDARIFVVTGTPAAVPVDPAPPASCLVLARVNVPALDTSITNSQITDLRTFASAVGGIHRTVPGSPLRGDTWFDSTTNRLMRRVFIGATDRDVIIGGHYPSTNCTRTTALTVSDSTATAVNLLNEVVDTDGFHSGGNNVFTVPAGMGGDYDLAFGGIYAADADGYRMLQVVITSNAVPAAAGELGTVRVQAVPGNTVNNGISAAKNVQLEAGAVLTLTTFHTAGNSLDLNPAYMTLAMTRHRPDLT